MADIKVKGFVNKPSTKSGTKGDFSTFTLAEGVKGKDGKYTNVFYNVTNFHTSEPPEDGSRVEVSGWLKVRAYESNGQKRQSLDVIAEDVTLIDGPKPKASEEPAAEQEDEFGI